MLGGVHGKILHIDLNNGEVRAETPPENLYQLLVGGRALVAYLLLRDLAANTDALSPDNLLIFAPGIMQGTNLPGAGRHGRPLPGQSAPTQNSHQLRSVARLECLLLL